jgi:hypothetical protein
MPSFDPPESQLHLYGVIRRQLIESVIERTSPKLVLIGHDTHW